MKKKRYLIFGGAGFLGKRLAESFDENFEIHIFDLEKKISKNIFKKNNFKFIYGDVRRKSTFDKIEKKKFHKVYFFSAIPSVIIYEKKKKLCVDTNIIGVINFVNWAKKNKLDHIIFSSSMAVYDKLSKNVKESDEKKPESLYGISKIFGENLIQTLKSKKTQVTILRLFNIYGPGQDMRNLYQGMLSIYLAQIIKTKKVYVTGSLKRFRDFVYVDDVVKALKINFKNNNDNIFNVGSGKSTKVFELIQIIFRLLGLKPKIIEQKGHEGDTFGTFANINKIKKLGWKPKTSLIVGIKKTIKSLNL